MPEFYYKALRMNDIVNSIKLSNSKSLNANNNFVIRPPTKRLRRCVYGLNETQIPYSTQNKSDNNELEKV